MSVTAEQMGTSQPSQAAEAAEGPVIASGGSTVISGNMSRHAALTDLTLLTSAALRVTPVYLIQGQVVTNISFCSGGTAINTPANWWFALYSILGAALLAQTADQTSTAWAANTIKTVALTAAQTIGTTGIYIVGIMVKGAATCTLFGRAAGHAVLTPAGSYNGTTADSGLTATAPALVGAVTGAVGQPWCELT